MWPTIIICIVIIGFGVLYWKFIKKLQNTSFTGKFSDVVTADVERYLRTSSVRINVSEDEYKKHSNKKLLSSIACGIGIIIVAVIACLINMEHVEELFEDMVELIFLMIMIGVPVIFLLIKDAIKLKAVKGSCSYIIEAVVYEIVRMNLNEARVRMAYYDFVCDTIKEVSVDMNNTDASNYKEGCIKCILVVQRNKGLDYVSMVKR